MGARPTHLADIISKKIRKQRENELEAISKKEKWFEIKDGDGL